MSNEITTVLFDAGDTLIRREPSEPRRFADILDELGFDVDERAAEMAWYHGEIWAAGQILREIGGEPRMDDAAFERGMAEAAVHSCERLGDRPAENIYVGDHPFDVVSSKNAGLRSLWVAPDFAWMPDGVTQRADWRVETLADVIKVLDSASK